MNKHLFRHKVTVAIGTSVLILSLGVVSPAKAATQDTTSAQTDSFLSGNQVTSQIQDFIKDVRSFVQGDLFGQITQLVQKTMGAVQIPDLGQVVSEIMKGGAIPEDFLTATQLENNLPKSYAIQQDLAHMSERVGAMQTAQTQTLSQTAQEQSKKKLEYSITQANEAAQMAQDSQNSDTSQHILQNISNQLKNQAAITDLQMKEASQARQDRALQLTLTAQAAQELNAANIRERQTTITAGNAATAQGALLTMPGGTVFGQDSSISSNQ